MSEQPIMGNEQLEDAMERIAELEAELENRYNETEMLHEQLQALEAENRRLWKSAGDLEDNNNAIHARYEALREAAEEYSYNGHFPDCKIHRPAIGVCNCGYDELNALLLAALLKDGGDE